MRKIVDSNYLNDPGLKTYLAASKNNYAVLCDYFAMEAYKSKSPIEGIFESMAILSQFPQQIIVLRNTAAIRRLKPAKAGLQRRLIDDVGTKNFSKFYINVRNARSGGGEFAAKIWELGHNAVTFADKLNQEAEPLRNAIMKLGLEFSASERTALREDSPWSHKLTAKFADQFIGLLASYYEEGGLAVPMVTLGELRFTFNFRYVLCCYILTLRWIANGCPPSNPDKIRNHIFDSAFAAYATFFDGFLSRDAEAILTYQKARDFLVGSYQKY